MGVVATVLLASAGAFSSSLTAVESSGRASSGAVFLDTVLQNLQTQSYDSLLAMNGNQFFDETNANDSQYSVDLSTFLADTDLLQVVCTLVDLRTNQNVGRVVTLRSQR